MLPNRDRSRVVLVGASRFTDEELPDLPAVRNNLDGLAACLRDIGRCTVVADPDSPVELVDPIHDAAAEAEDTLVVYYAGHGLIHPRTLGLLLAVVGSRPGRTHTAVPYDVLRECMLDSPAPRKVVILDCCYSGRAIGGMADPTTALADEATVEGTYLLASAPPNKQALSPPGERYTAFTGALLTLLTEGVPNGPPLLHLDLLYRHVRDALRRAARPEPQLRTGNTAGELALVRNPWHGSAAPLTPILDVPIINLGAAEPARHKAVRERLKELVRETGPLNSYACPACHATVTGGNLIRHFDKHSPGETASLDPITLALTVRPVLLDDRYELGEPIGGAGAVRLATDTVTKQTVVVKEQLAHRVPDRVFRLDHPAIVRILAVLRVTLMRSHLVLEYVDGRTVGEALRSHGPMEPFQAAKIMIDVCAALDYARQHSVAHGDVGSRNVMLTRDGAVKMLNFGSIDTLDYRADLYAAGRLLVELLTGSPAVFGNPVPSGIPVGLDKVIHTALHPDLSDRYQTASAMRDDLMRVVR